MLNPKALLLACLLAAPAVEADPAPSPGGFLPQGFAFGDVTSSSAVFWTRLPSGHGLLELRDGAAVLRKIQLAAGPADDFTTQVELDGLAANRRYGLRLAALDAAGAELESREGELRTAPAAGEKAELSFVMSGDLGGQGYCRHPEKGYAIFSAMRALAPDFFVANGDMIYADSICPPKNPDGQPNLVSDYLDVSDKSLDWRDPAKTFEAFAGHWRYNRADRHFQDFLARTAIYTQWDDHEVINDFGSPWKEWPNDPDRPGYPQLVSSGTRALFLYNPIRRHPEEPQRIYRSFSWGADLDLFLVDARSYRSANDATDRPSNAKTALGKKQLEWLKKSLRESRATFKVISNDVPISLPTGSQPHLFGRDAFANGTTGDFSQRTGFESELVDFLTFLDRENIDNVVLLVTDVHFSMQLRYALDLDGDGDLLTFHELVAGPLAAVRTVTPFQLDPTFRPITLFAQGDIFNFLFVRLERGADGTPRLAAEIRDESGRILEGSRLEIAPRMRDKG
jgi:alkaline phosphatase D